MVNESFPVKKRGSTTGVFCIALASGVCFSFSLGKIFGDLLNEYWKFFLILPAGLCFLRMVIILTFYNHKTPKQIVSESQDKQEGLKQAELVMQKYYDNLKDIKKAKNELKNLIESKNNKNENSGLINDFGL